MGIMSYRIGLSVLIQKDRQLVSINQIFHVFGIMFDK